MIRGAFQLVVGFVTGWVGLLVLLLVIGLLLAGIARSTYTTPVPAQVHRELVRREERESFAGEESAREAELVRKLGHPLGE